MKLMLAAVLLAASLFCCPLNAADLHGQVVGVIDGDTMDVLVGERDLHRVRLAGIDAPEKGQPFGQQAKRWMSDLVFGKPVKVEYDKRDMYKRIVGIVRWSDIDVGLDLVRSGLAWHYKRYQGEQTPEDRAAYAGAEDEARSAKRGLWRDEKPTPPWLWRQKGGK